MYINTTFSIVVHQGVCSYAKISSTMYSEVLISELIILTFYTGRTTTFSIDMCKAREGD